MEKRGRLGATLGKPVKNTAADPKPPSGMSGIYLNARSIKTVSSSVNKLVELHNLVSSHEASIVAVTETWLNANVLDGEILPARFCLHRKDRSATCPDRRGGGILLAVDASLSSTRRQDLEPPCEILVCEIAQTGSTKIAVLLCYRPPSSDFIAFVAHLEQTLVAVCRQYSLVGLLGDFNLPGIEWMQPPVTNSDRDLSFVHLMNSYNLSQLNVTPSNMHGHFLDLIFSNTEGLITDIGGLNDEFPTDHTVLRFNLNMKRVKPQGPKRVLYNYKRADYEALFTQLRSILSAHIVNCIDVNELWSYCYNAVTQAVESAVPKVSSNRGGDAPWIDGEARHVIHLKNTAWRRAKRLGTEEAWARYRVIRNRCKTLLRSKYDDFVNLLAVTCKSNPKRFWSFVKAKSNNRSIPVTVHLHNVENSDPLAKATLFNEYFTSVFNGNAMPLPPNPHPPFVVSDSIPDPVFTTYQVHTILCSLNQNKACPPSDISPVILSKCSDVLAPILNVLFNTSIQSHSVPNEWKKAHIVPVFKKGDKQSVQNYRPISLLPAVSKVMERLIFNHLYPFLECKIHPLQHGFMKGRSCCTQLLKVYHEIGSILDKGGQIDVIFLDFSKAFDCVPHNLLLYKLESFYGISGNMLEWFRDYLTDRKQKVLVENVCSEFEAVTSGVPQGSILGPLMFLLYINDMAFLDTSCSIALFADDSKCFKQVRSSNDCLSLQHDLDVLYKWSCSWQMDFNASKCKVLSITRSHDPIVFNYCMNGTPLEKVGSFKDLGVVVDETLSFTEHVNSTISKSSKVCGFIKRSLGFNAPTSVKLQLYLTLCRTVLDYGSVLWSPQSKLLIKQLETVQRSMTKYILNDFVSPYTLRCSALHILPLSFRREMSDLLFFFKFFIIKRNSLFSDEIRPCERNPNLRSSNTLSLHCPIVRTERFMSSYFIRIVRLWNNLPVFIKGCTNFNDFKSNLLSFYTDKVVDFNVERSCTWTTICRCTGFYH